jgi:hypothetical protein
MRPSPDRAMARETTPSAGRKGGLPSIRAPNASLAVGRSIRRSLIRWRSRTNSRVLSAGERKAGDSPGSRGSACERSVPSVVGGPGRGLQASTSGRCSRICNASSIHVWLPPPKSMSESKCST